MGERLGPGYKFSKLILADYQLHPFIRQLCSSRLFFLTEAERPKSKCESKNERFVALHCEITRKSRVELGVGAGGWNWDGSARKLSISQIG